MLAELSSALIAEVERAAELLESKQHICLLTGAGISAESGIPTFRDNGADSSWLVKNPILPIQHWHSGSITVNRLISN